MIRRNLIKSGPLLTAVALGGAAAPVAANAQSRGIKTFLFVHGGWHAGTHFNKVVAWLTLLGHRAIAIDLPGSGLNALYPKSYLADDFTTFETEVSPLKNLRLSDYANHVSLIVEGLAQSGPITLVGHSFGGLTITLVAERVPHLIHRLVYLTAFCPVLLPSATAYNALPENGPSLSPTIYIGDPSQTGAIRINPRSGDTSYLHKGQAAFYNDVPYDEFIRFAVYLNPDLSLQAANDDARGTYSRWGSVPRTFIRCLQDHAIPIALQDRMIREADATTPGNQFNQRTLNSSHSAFASMPLKLAETLVSLA